LKSYPNCFFRTIAANHRTSTVWSNFVHLVHSLVVSVFYREEPRSKNVESITSFLISIISDFDSVLDLMVTLSSGSFIKSRTTRQVQDTDPVWERWNSASPKLARHPLLHAAINQTQQPVTELKCQQVCIYLSRISP